MTRRATGSSGRAAGATRETTGMTGTPYHRLGAVRAERSAGARPLLILGATLVVYLILASVLLVGTVLVLALLPGVNAAQGIRAGDPASVLDVGLALGMGALWLPAAMVGLGLAGRRPLRTAWSVALRVRRGEHLGLLGAAMGLLTLGAAAAAGALVGEGTGAAEPVGILRVLLVMLVVLLLGPLQAVGLELALRGVVLQALGGWARSPLLGFGLATAVMLIGREPAAAVTVPALVLGCCSALLVWKTGGLELSISLVTTLTVASHLVVLLGAGSGAAAGAAALEAASAAPATSLAALAAGPGSGATAGGMAAALALAVLTLVVMALFSLREGLTLRRPLTRPDTAAAGSSAAR